MVKECYETGAVELFFVIDHELLRDSEATYYVLLEELMNAGRSDVVDWFCFDPLGKVFNCHDCVCIISPGLREWPDDVHAPSCKWPNWGDYLHFASWEVFVGACILQLEQPRTVSSASATAEGQ